MVKNNRWIPTQQECNLIKAAAVLESEPRLSVNTMSLEVGRRLCLNNGHRPHNINVCLVSENPDPMEMSSDTDLFECDSWSVFRKGVELDPNGRAVVDFYIRTRLPVLEDYHGCSIFGNVVVHFFDGKIEAIHSVGFGGRTYPVT
uniref:Uncharacterized protein n=1 Tax=Pseudomonas phage Cygsa01 TaxID=3138529 RepID=A0AAU6W3P5_9VIRU